ncbi:hypothetical protein, partial [Methylobacterium sp. 37f]|uniref:hypothetical protein n=1 Tax=Methylobacterium sp. 37f TaxID=2817058 RepID=UPI001FFCE1F9
MCRSRGIPESFLDEVEPSAIEPEVANGPATRDEIRERLAEDARRALGPYDDGVERSDKLAEFAGRGDRGSADLVRQRPPADRERCDSIPPRQMVPDVRPIPGPGWRTPLNPNGVDDRTQRLFAKSEEPKHRFFRGQPANDAGDFLRSGLEGLGELDGKAEVPLPFQGDGPG